MPRLLCRCHSGHCDSAVWLLAHVFVVLCGSVGLYLGRKSDRDPEFFGRLADDFLDRLNRLR